MLTVETKNSIIRGYEIAVPNLVQLPWHEYAPKYPLFDRDTGGAKCQGMLFAIYVDGKLEFRGIFGEIPNPPLSQETIEAKTGILKDNPDFDSSLQGRDPSKRLWGGAIRASTKFEYLNEVHVTTGWPELADVTIVGSSMHLNKRLTSCAYESVIDPRNPKVIEARKFVGMTPESYGRMVNAIRNIMLAAHEKVIKS